MKRGSRLKLQPKQAKWILDTMDVYDIAGALDERSTHELCFYMALAMYARDLRITVMHGHAGFVFCTVDGTEFRVSGKPTKRGTLLV